MQIGALFDWDGVIIDSAAQHEQSWNWLAELERLPLAADHFKRGFGLKNERIIPGILGWTSDPEEVARLSNRKEELYRELVVRDGVAPLPGVREFLEGLHKAGVPCAVGSSTHRANIETIFRITGLGPFFTTVVAAQDVSHGKPDPEVFLKGAERIGVPPARCVVFEDAFAGLEAARAGGMKSVGVATTNAAAALDGKADRVVHRLDELDVAALVALVDGG
jgi:beta-phosphoglucomutase family hydrolase